MISVLFVGLGSHLRGGITVWQRATTTSDTLQRRRVAFEQLERDLANALVFDDRAASYGDQAGQLPLPQFGTASATWFTLSAAARRQDSAIRLVSYSCQEVDGVRGLWRTSQSVASARVRTVTPERERLLPDCEELAFRYAYQPPESAEPQGWQWRSSWPDDSNTPLKLPRLVEVSVVIGGQRLQRVMTIPIGSLGQGTPLPS